MSIPQLKLIKSDFLFVNPWERLKLDSSFYCKEQECLVEKNKNLTQILKSTHNLNLFLCTLTMQCVKF